MARLKNIQQYTEELGVVSAASASDPVPATGVSVLGVQAINDVQSSAKTFDSGGAEVDTATFQAKASTGSGDYVVIYDTDGNGWAVAADLTGSDPEPTGAVWDDIPAARKTQVDLSAATTAANVATAFASAFNGLTDVPITALAASADVGFTGDVYGVVTAPEVHNEDDSGAGSIAVVVTDAGVNSEVNVTDNEVTIPSHGYLTGAVGQLTATGTLPAPLATGTDYYIIKVDANTVKFATSAANAEAGTAVNITDQGSDENVSTFTPTAISGASIKLQKSNDGTNWADEGSATNVTTDGNFFLAKVDPEALWYRAYVAISAGSFGCTLKWLLKGVDG